MSDRITQRFKSSAGEIAWDVKGEGPDVILVHGTPANSVIWDETIHRLSDRYRIHYIDLPGYGESDKYEGQDVRLRAFARVIAEFLYERNLTQAHLVGHDFGATAVLGAHLVENAPAASIIIADGVVLSPWGTRYSRHVNQHEKVFSVIPDYIHRATLAAHLNTAVSRPMPDSMMDALIEPWVGEVGQAAYYRQIAQFDYEYTDILEKKYPGLEIPLRVLWGEEDRWVCPSEARRLKDIVPVADLRMLPDAGHFSMIDTPGLFARELDTALSGNRE